MGGDNPEGYFTPEEIKKMNDIYDAGYEALLDMAHESGTITMDMIEDFKKDYRYKLNIPDNWWPIKSFQY